MGRGQCQASLKVVAAAYEILEEIQPASVRAVCYRLFTMGLMKSMEKSETNKISYLLTPARHDGRIPWEWIVDETREVELLASWDNPGDYARGMQHRYRKDHWQNQKSTVEVWSEKGTIRGMLKPVLDRYGVAFRVMHGYGSTTAIHDAAEDFKLSDKPRTVYYIGDHDPDGMGMSEKDIPKRLETEEIYQEEGQFSFERLALSAADVLNPDLPGFAAATKGPRPGSKGSSNYAWYVANYGPKCWELDALSPVILRDRVEAAILTHIEPRAWARIQSCQKAEREAIVAATKGWNNIIKLARK